MARGISCAKAPSCPSFPAISAGRARRPCLPSATPCLGPFQNPPRCPRASPRGTRCMFLLSDSFWLIAAHLHHLGGGCAVPGGPFGRAQRKHTPPLPNLSLVLQRSVEPIICLFQSCGEKGLKVVQDWRQAPHISQAHCCSSGARPPATPFGGWPRTTHSFFLRSDPEPEAGPSKQSKQPWRRPGVSRPALPDSSAGAHLVA